MSLSRRIITHDIHDTSKTHKVSSNTHRVSIEPLHRVEVLGTLLFLSLFILFSLLILSSRLNPAKLAGHAQSVVTGVNVTAGESFLCNYTLVKGTNLVSFPCLPPIISRDDLLSNLSNSGTNVGAIYLYTPSSMGDWQVYNSSLPSYVVQSLNSITQVEGIYFVMNGQERFVYSGYMPKNTQINLISGWNLVAYLNSGTKQLSQAVVTINDTYMEIKTLEGTEESGSYLIDYAPPGGDTLTNMSTYHGYWIRENKSDMWAVGQ